MKFIETILNFFTKLFSKSNSDVVPPKKPDKIIVITHEKIKLLYPKMREKSQKLVNKIKELGIDADIFMSYRSFDEQAKLYAKGRTEPGNIVTNSKPGYSFHNYGLAIDIVFKKNGSWSWHESHDWERLGKLGKEIGLHWGGDWGWDKPHFELNFGHKVNDLLLVFNKTKQLDDVWAHLDAAG